MIVFGRRAFRSRKSFFKAQCAVCGEHRLHELVTLRMADHIYFVPVTRGVESHREVKCSGCGALTARELEPSEPSSASPASAPDVVRPSLPASQVEQLVGAIRSLEYLARLDGERSVFVSIRAVLSLVLMIASVPTVLAVPGWGEGQWPAWSVVALSVLVVSLSGVVGLSLGMRRLRLRRVIATLRRAFARRTPIPQDVAMALDAVKADPFLGPLRPNDFD
ncbi:MAG: hypothetical protein Q8S33_38005 [Myxococcales bacterium]|nr:hypothetical protein [Myxococcales bacterium]